MPTNFKKLVGWDLDIYNEMSDDECLVCLTEKERYLLGQMTRQVEWVTRWDNFNSGTLPDLSVIAGKLDDKMSLQGCIDFCQYMIDCINDPDSGVSDTIINTVYDNTADNARENGQSQNETNLSTLNDSCDEDILFGQCMQLVDYLDRINEDMLEIIEVETNDFEMVSEVIGDITVIDETSIDAVLAWVEKVQDNIAENYTAQVTVSYKEELACGIFCLAKEQNCQVTPTLLFFVLNARLAGALDIGNLLWQSLSYLVAGSWSGSEIADFMFFAQIAFRSQLGRFIGKVAYLDIQSRLAIYSNDPDSDWNTLCTNCAWEHTFDFTVDSGASDGWAKGNWGDGWVNGKGWESQNHINQNELNYLDLTFPEDTDITYISITRSTDGTQANFGAGSYATYQAVRWYIDAVATLVYNDQINNDPIDLSFVAFSSANEVTMDRINIQANPFLANPNKWYYSSVTLRGVGNNPFE